LQYPVQLNILAKSGTSSLQ